MKTIFHFKSPNGRERFFEPFVTFDECGTDSIENEIHRIRRTMELNDEIYVFQFLATLYLRVGIKMGILDRDKIEFRVYSNDENYEVIRIDPQGELEFYPEQLDTMTNVLFKLI